MTRLVELQQAFQHRVLRGEPGVEAHIAGNESFDAQARLGIYEHAFISRLVEALGVMYPGLRGTLGEAEFESMTRAYVTQSPPTHFSVRYFGNDLAAFIARHFPGARARVLNDIARWEWALGEVFDASDAVLLTPTDLASYAAEQWGELRFRFTPALRTVTLRTNSLQWWRAATQDGPKPSRWLAAAPATWALWRSNLKTYFRVLRADEEWAIEAMLSGQTFASLCDELAQFGGSVDAPTRAAVMLHRWFSNGWIAGIDDASAAATYFNQVANDLARFTSGYSTPH